MLHCVACCNVLQTFFWKGNLNRNLMCYSGGSCGVSFAKEPHKRDCILQKRSIIWRSPLMCYSGGSCEVYFGKELPPPYTHRKHLRTCSTLQLQETSCVTVEEYICIYTYSFLLWGFFSRRTEECIRIHIYMFLLWRFFFKRRNVYVYIYSWWSWEVSFVRLLFQNDCLHPTLCNLL